MTRRPHILMLLFSLSLVACTDGTAGAPAGTEDETSRAAERASSEPSHEVGETARAGAFGRIELAGVQQTHASATTVAVSAIEVDEAGDVFVEFDALVAGARPASLASEHVHLFDDLGNRYEWVPPALNENLNVDQDSRVRARFAFAGPIDEGATRVSFGLNGYRELAPLDDRPARTRRPSFAFHGLPLPGVGLDAEAAGADARVGLDLSSVDVDVTGFVHEGPAQVRIEVTRIEVSPTTVLVDVTAHNQSDRDRNLTQRRPVLRAERDGQSFENAYPFELQHLTTPEGDLDRLTLGPGDEVEATFAFRGVVPPNATGLRLGIQTLDAEVDRGSGVEERDVGSPSVIFTGLPLPEGRVGTDLRPADDAPQAGADGFAGLPADERGHPLPASTVSIVDVDAPESSAEIRVGEIIVEFDGEVTTEGTVLTLQEPILFAFDSADLRSSADAALDDIAEVLGFYDDAPVEVRGHTDDVGSASYNLGLSQERADAVTDGLLERGIDAARISAVGRGQEEPVVSNDTEEGRARNRRVEVLIVGVEPPRG